eukprot:7013310-Lingulodinium_polyedra.AAC.1
MLSGSWVHARPCPPGLASEDSTREFQGAPRSVCMNGSSRTATTTSASAAGHQAWRRQRRCS